MAQFLARVQLHSNNTELPHTHPDYTKLHSLMQDIEFYRVVPTGSPAIVYRDLPTGEYYSSSYEDVDVAGNAILALEPKIPSFLYFIVTKSLRYTTYLPLATRGRSLPPL